jgi:hypothetical protein
MNLSNSSRSRRTTAPSVLVARHQTRGKSPLLRVWRRALGLVAVGVVASSLGEVNAASADPNGRESTVVRRFALLTGASQGGPDRVRLRFAASDAHAMERVLADLGGLGESDTILLMESGREGLRAGFAALKARVAGARTPGVRTEMIFYYSGHSDENGLLLGAERVSYPEIRAWVDDTGADVRIAVLDSCASGALTRNKGGLHRPPFLVDNSSAARGHAYLTASSENEAAQESDRLGAAYFTHYLVSGLRGAADASHDGRVTLAEAYQYAFTETLARTESSRGGPQHASYDFQLAGKGDLVMTDLRATSASLVLPAEMSGRLFVRDANNQLVAEVHKLPSQPIELGLPPGRYRLTLDDNRRLSETTVVLAVGESHALVPAQLVALVPTGSTSRGGGQPAAGDTEAGPTSRASPVGTLVQPVAAATGPARAVAVDLSIVPGFDTNGGVPADNHVVFGFLARSASLSGLSLTLGHEVLHDGSGVQIGALGALDGGGFRGVQLSGGGSVTRGDVRGLQIAGIGNYTDGSVRGVQYGGAIDWARGGLDGLQMSGAVSAAAGGRGAQVAGGVNMVGADFVGVQIAGAVNAATTGRLSGVQLAGGANVASGISGLQLAVVNVGGDVTGAQIGVVNVAHKVRGTQIGVVNLADDMEGVSFGLVTLVRNGIHEVELSTSEVGTPVLSALLGTRHFYTKLGAGFLAPAADIPGGRDVAVTSSAAGRRFLAQWSLGGRATVNERWVIDSEVGATQYFDTANRWSNDKAVTGSARVLAAVRLVGNLRLVFGPTYNVAVGYSGTDLVTSAGVAEATLRSGQTTVRMYPGLLLGIRI